LISFLLIVLMAAPAGWTVADTQSSHSHDDCPCCPDHGGSITDCLSACVASIAMPAFSLPAVQLDRGARPPVHIAATFSSRADLPFKPPPIR
jgi:hypothetical protein